MRDLRDQVDTVLSTAEIHVSFIEIGKYSAEFFSSTFSLFIYLFPHRIDEIQLVLLINNPGVPSEDVVTPFLKAWISLTNAFHPRSN